MKKEAKPLRSSHHTSEPQDYPANSNQIQLIPTLKQTVFIGPAPSPLPPLSVVALAKADVKIIRVYSFPLAGPKSDEGGSVVQLGAKLKNYQTNPFVIFQFARGYCVLSSCPAQKPQKRTHLTHSTRRGTHPGTAPERRPPARPETKSPVLITSPTFIASFAFSLFPAR